MERKHNRIKRGNKGIENLNEGKTRGEKLIT